MKKVFFLFFLLAFFNCSKFNKTDKINNESILDNCLPNEDVKNIKKGVSSFKNFLINHYHLDDKNDFEIYLKYLDELSIINSEYKILNSSEAKKLLNQFKETSTFQLLYKKKSKVEMVLEDLSLDSLSMQNLGSVVLDFSDQEPLEDSLFVNNLVENDELNRGSINDYVVLYRKSEFISCIYNKTDDEKLKDYINIFDEMIDFSPNAKAFGFAKIIRKNKNITEEEVLLICYELFYGLVVAFNNI
jgi:hypothetical protein